MAAWKHLLFACSHCYAFWLPTILAHRIPTHFDVMRVMNQAVGGAIRETNRMIRPRCLRFF
jgi:hypothetical protein